MYCHINNFTITERNVLLKEAISQYRIQFFGNWNAFLLKKQNLLPEEEIYCHRKKFNVTGRNIKVQEGISYDKNKFPATRRNLLSKEGFLLAQVHISFHKMQPFCHLQKIYVARRNFLPRSNLFPVKLKMQEKRREFPKTFCLSPPYFVGDYIPISPGISHPGQHSKSHIWRD